jgi:molecular chaperone DnaJ
MGKDYYNILGITRSAKDADIKAAYRKISLNFHPIKVPGDNKHAADKYRESAEAYDVLSNRKSRVLFFFPQIIN